jgi:acetyl esterase/lipase
MSKPRILLLAGALPVVVLALVLVLALPTTDAASSASRRAVVMPRELTGVRYGPQPEQLLDVHVPLGVPGPLPVVVFAHPGGWIGGDRTGIPDVIRTLIDDLNVAVVSIDYRLAREDGHGGTVNPFPTASYDMDRAIRFVRSRAEQWGLDPGLIIAAGASAGGQLASLAGVAPGTFSDPELSSDLIGVSPVVQGVINYVGPSDFHTFPDAGSWAPGLTAAFLNCGPAGLSGCDPRQVEAASVATHLRAGVPPAYLAYGEQDPLVSAATQGAPLALTWATVRGDVERPVHEQGVRYESQPRAGHNFDLTNSEYLAMEQWLTSVLTGRLR